MKGKGETGATAKGGWVGRILRVDLGSRRVAHEPTSRYTAYVGGAGIAARIFLDAVEPSVGALDPKNPLILMTGPLTGTPAPSSGRVVFYAKSPVGYPHAACRPSSIGGGLGAELKYAGFDGLVVEGASPEPVYLWIEDGEAEVRDASDLWGLDTFETQAALLRRHDADASVACIGPSGEHLGRMAAIVHGTGFASGLSGYGAVMGAKRLKAIGVRGHGGVSVADPAGLLAAVRRVNDLVYRADDPPRMTGMRGLGDSYPGGHEFIGRYSVGILACHACPVACQGVFRVPGTPLGADCCVWPHPLGYGYTEGVEGWEAIWDANSIVNRLGLGAYELQQAFRFVLQLYDAGLLDEKESGLPLSGDRRELVRALATQIAYREGIGDQLAELLPRAAARMGSAARESVIESRGWPLLLSSDDPRRSATLALLAAAGAYPPYNDTWALWGSGGGSYHLPVSDERETLGQADVAKVTRRVLGDEAAIDPGTCDAKAGAVWRAQTYRMLADSLGFCTWVLPLECGYYREDLAGDDAALSDLYTAVTGIETDQDELLRLGERIAALERLQGARHGYHSRAEDLRALDERVFRERDPDSPLPGQVIDERRLAGELERYYRLRGWHCDTGLPTEATLRRLGMDDLVGLLDLSS